MTRLDLDSFADKEGERDNVDELEDRIYTNDIKNQVINDDSLEIMKQLSSNCVDLILTDPPYGIDIGNKDGRIGGEKRGVDAEVNEYSDLSDGVSWDADRIDKEFFEEMLRISKNQIIFGGNYYTDFLYPTSCWIVWDKQMSGNFADAELAWASFDQPVKKFEWRWCGMIRKGNEEKYHPTQKPVGLFKKILKYFSDDGDLILDPFLGAGTTAVASKKMNREYIGIEKEEKYVDISRERLEKVQSGKNGLSNFVDDEIEDEDVEEEIKGYAVRFSEPTIYDDVFFDKGDEVIITANELDGLIDVVQVMDKY